MTDDDLEEVYENAQTDVYLAQSLAGQPRNESDAHVYALRAVFEAGAREQQPTRKAPMKLWLWRNFVDGDPQYWAFESPFPTYENGDPITLGSPSGYAIVKPCIDGREGRTDESVVAEIKRAMQRAAPLAKVGP